MEPERKPRVICWDGDAIRITGEDGVPKFEFEWKEVGYVSTMGMSLVDGRRLRFGRKLSQETEVDPFMDEWRRREPRHWAKAQIREVNSRKFIMVYPIAGLLMLIPNLIFGGDFSQGLSVLGVLILISFPAIYFVVPKPTSRERFAEVQKILAMEDASKTQTTGT